MRWTQVLGLALLGILCMTIVFAAYFWRAFMPPRPGSSSGISSAADEEWTLGDVIVTRYKSEKTGVSAYSFVTGNGYLWINSIIYKEGPVKSGASYMSGSRDPVMISIEPSSDPILSVPPGEFSTALTEAQKIARSAISIKVWPLKLLGARRMVSDIADGKIRVICGADHMTANVSSAVYDSNDDLSIVTFGSFMEQRCILRMHDEPGEYAMHRSSNKLQKSWSWKTSSFP